jgi:hypothetical protein
MKKTTTKFLFLVALIFFLSACASDNQETEKNNVDQKNTSENASSDPEYIRSLKDFLDSETVDKFYKICEDGKNIEIFKEKEILSEDKKTIIKAPMNLKESLPSCVKLGGDEFIFVEKNERKLDAILIDGESDDTRLKKIKYNEEVENRVYSKGGVYGYRKKSQECIQNTFRREDRNKILPTGSDCRGNTGITDFKGPYEGLVFPGDEIRDLIRSYKEYLKSGQ